MNELLKTLETIKHQNIDEVVELLYVIKAWMIISKTSQFEEELTFKNFFNQKIDAKKLSNIFQTLSKTVRLFQLYRFNSRLLHDEDLAHLFNIAHNTNNLPSVNDAFYMLNRKYDFYVPNQLAELGVKLLDAQCEELYVPFTNGFAYAYYTDQKIYADFFMSHAEFIAELVKIIDAKKIEFYACNALETPPFTQPNAPHLLRQFKSVLSFPPFGQKGKMNTTKDKFHRFHFHKGTVLDIAYFEHILSQTLHKAAVLMPVGITYRGGVEEEFRKYLIEQNYLESIIQLPPNLHNATSIETTFFVINKQKTTHDVLFINVKNERFIIRDGRKLVFKNIDEIIDIFKSKKVIEDISSLVDTNAIVANNYSFAIDRYVIGKEALALQKNLNKLKLIKMEEIAEVRRSQLFQDEGEGKEIYEISPSDFNKAGFTLECGKVKQIGSQYKKLQTYKLEPYDVLLSTKGTIGKVAIMGTIAESMIASQAIQVIRFQEEDKKNKAITVYMFLKSTLGQTILASLVAGVAMPQIPTSEIKQLSIPLLRKEQEKELLKSFEEEQQLYGKLEEVQIKIKTMHENFLGVNQ